MISMTITGGEVLMRRMSGLSAAFRGHALDVALLSAADPVVNDAKRRARYVTGNLRRSITKAIIKPHTVAVGTDVVYARMVEYGGTIRPRNGRFLVFEIDGRKVFARQVTQRARPYLRPALDENRGIVEREFRDALRLLITAEVSR